MHSVIKISGAVEISKPRIPLPEYFSSWFSRLSSSNNWATPFSPDTTRTAVPLTATVTVLRAARGGKRHTNPKDKAITSKTYGTHCPPEETEVCYKSTELPAPPPLSQNKSWCLLHPAHLRFITLFLMLLKRIDPLFWELSWPKPQSN